MSKFKEYLEYYKRKLERHMTDENTVNLVIEKLNKTEFPAADLLNTGIYKIIRGMSKSAGEYAEKALPLYNKWKMLILAEQQHDLIKSNPVQNNIPAVRVNELIENHVNDSSKNFPIQPIEIRNGFPDMIQKNASISTNINDKPQLNPSPLNEGVFKTKSSTPVQPPVNKFQPFSNFNSSFTVHNVKLNENPSEVKNAADMSDTFDSQSNLSTGFSSPQSSNSQNPLDIGAPSTASPSKIGRIPEPYTIEMKEGMFRTVKSSEGLTPEIIRVRRMYNRDEDYYDSASERDKIEEQVKPPKNPEQSKSVKTSKVVNEKNSEKSLSSKIKTAASDKPNKHKSNGEKSMKLEKVKAYSPTNKAAIEKKVKEKNTEVLKPEKKFSPHKVLTKSNIKGSPIRVSIKNSPTFKLSSKGSPAKASNRESPVKSNAKPTISIKSNSKESASVKLNTKSSPSFFANNANSTSCDIKRGNLGHKDCDRMSIKVLSNDAAEYFISSKKERTSVYSGKKTLQEILSLRSSCVRVLKKNIECIKYTKQVPYELLKPVLQHCSPYQLRRIEEYNPHLIKNTDEIWKSFYLRKFRDMKPGSPCSWRDLYQKTLNDHTKKLRSITASISASMQKTAPEKQMKLTLIESPERPRNKKMKLSLPEPKSVKISPKESISYNNSIKESNVNKIIPKEPTLPIHQKTPSKESISISHKKAKKAPVAPLMSKVKKSFGLISMQKK